MSGTTITAWTVITLVASIHFGEADVPPPPETEYSWDDVTFLNDIFLFNPEPVGFDHSNPVFLCLAIIDEAEDIKRPGVLVIGNGEIHCRLCLNGEEHKIAKFKILNARPGFMSWEIYEGNLPKNAVAYTSSGQDIYFCRAHLEDMHLLPGELDQETKTCKICSDGKLLTIDNPDQFPMEVLHQNPMAFRTL